MAISASLLPEFDMEMANTRKTLERVPEDKFDWKPHRKSWSLRELATHIANLPVWANHTIDEDSIDIAPKDGEPPKAEPANSVEELLDIFDKNISKARASIETASDERFHQTWSLLSGGETVFQMPKVVVLRSFVMNHIIHHRAQLGVYLRMNDVALPAIYGPTADEGQM